MQGLASTVEHHIQASHMMIVLDHTMIDAATKELGASCSIGWRRKPSPPPRELHAMLSRQSQNLTIAAQCIRRHSSDCWRIHNGGDQKACTCSSKFTSRPASMRPGSTCLRVWSGWSGGLYFCSPQDHMSMILPLTISWLLDLASALLCSVSETWILVLD